MANITVNEDMDIVENWFHPDSSQNDSTSNDYLNLINDILVGQYKAADYSSDWSTVSLPSSPSHGKHVVRVNTNSNEMRHYFYNGEASAWEFVAITSIDDDNFVTIDTIQTITASKTFNANQNIGSTYELNMGSGQLVFDTDGTNGFIKSLTRTYFEIGGVTKGHIDSAGFDFSDEVIIGNQVIAHLIINSTDATTMDAHTILQKSGSSMWSYGTDTVGKTTEDFSVYNYTTTKADWWIEKTTGQIKHRKGIQNLDMYDPSQFTRVSNTLLYENGWLFDAVNEFSSANCIIPDTVPSGATIKIKVLHHTYFTTGSWTFLHYISSHAQDEDAAATGNNIRNGTSINYPANATARKNVVTEVYSGTTPVAGDILTVGIKNQTATSWMIIKKIWIEWS